MQHTHTLTYAIGQETRAKYAQFVPQCRKAVMGGRLYFPYIVCSPQLDTLLKMLLFDSPGDEQFV